MLKRIVAVILVALFSLAWAGNGIAEPKKDTKKDTTNQSKSDIGQKFQLQLNEATNPARRSPSKPQFGGGLLDNAGGGFYQNAPAPTGTPMAPPASRGAAGQVIK